VSELHIHYKSFVTKVYYHAGYTEYCKKFTVALKMIDVVDKNATGNALDFAKRKMHWLKLIK